LISIAVSTSLSAKIPKNFPCKWLFDFGVSWDRFDDARLRIDPNGMGASLAFQEAAGSPQTAFEFCSLHPTEMVSRTTPDARPRRPSSSRSSRIKATASRRLSFASSFVSPCPFSALPPITIRDAIPKYISGRTSYLRV